MYKVMVVDDDPSIREVLRIMLDSEGYKIISSDSGEDCMDKLNEVKPDYIFLDIMMPRMDGWEVLSRIKSDESLRDIPVSMLTARTLNSETLKRPDMGVLVDYISKPFRKEDILETLRQVLG